MITFGLELPRMFLKFDLPYQIYFNKQIIAHLISIHDKTTAILISLPYKYKRSMCIYKA